MVQTRVDTRFGSLKDFHFIKRKMILSKSANILGNEVILAENGNAFFTLVHDESAL